MCAPEIGVLTGTTIPNSDLDRAPFLVLSIFGVCVLGMARVFEADHEMARLWWGWDVAGVVRLALEERKTPIRSFSCVILERADAGSERSDRVWLQGPEKKWMVAYRSGSGHRVAVRIAQALHLRFATLKEGKTMSEVW